MSSSTMTAEQAGKLVSPYINRSFPNDRSSVFEILDLVQEIIWKTGMFDTPTKWAYAKVDSDGMVITPTGYNYLIGAKTRFNSLTLRDSYYMFHENGPLKEPSEDNCFTKSVVHLGSFPTRINHVQDSRLSKKCYKLGIVSKCFVPGVTPPFTVVSALNKNGNRIYTYSIKGKKEPGVIEDDKIIDLDADDIAIENDVIEGIIYPITGKLVVYNNILVTDIYNIRKDPTLSNVSYYLIDPDNESIAIEVADLDPFETISSYNAYKVPNECKRDGVIFGLFKRSKPESLVNDTQLVLTSSKTGLISLAKGVYEKFFKDNIMVGDSLISSGLKEIAQTISAENAGSVKTLEFKNSLTQNAKKRRFR